MSFPNPFSGLQLGDDFESVLSLYSDEECWVWTRDAFAAAGSPVTAEELQAVRLDLFLASMKRRLEATGDPRLAHLYPLFERGFTYAAKTVARN